MTNKLRVWWIPQVPGKPFHVEVNSVAEGVKIMDILADYDAFQFANNIKPDYANCGGLEQLEPDEDYPGDFAWYAWFDDETGHDDPRVYLEERNCCERVIHAPPKEGTVPIETIRQAISRVIAAREGKTL